MRILPGLENHDKTCSIDEVVKAFQIHFESGYLKVSALRAMDNKLSTCKISPGLTLGLRHCFYGRKENALMIPEQDSTFEIARPGPSSGVLEQSNSTESIQMPPPVPEQDSMMTSDMDLEHRLNQILGESYFR